MISFNSDPENTSGSGPSRGGPPQLTPLTRVEFDRQGLKEIIEPFLSSKISNEDGSSSNIRPNSIAAFALGPVEIRTLAQDTQNTDVSYPGVTGIANLVQQLKFFPEIVPGLANNFEELVSSGANISTGAGCYLPKQIRDIYALGNFLEVLAGTEFIEDPKRGFLGALTEKVMPLLLSNSSLGEDDKRILESSSEIYYKACALYAKFLRLYAIHSLDSIFKMQEVQIDYKMCEAAGRYPTSGESLPREFQTHKLSLERWKRWREESFLDLKRVSDNWLAGIDEASPIDRFCSLGDTRGKSSATCFSPVELAKEIKIRSEIVLEHTDRYVEAILKDILAGAN